MGRLMSTAKKPTPAQRAVLENLAAGRSATAHLFGMSAHGGFNGTRASLYRNQWIDAQGITQSGLIAIGKTVPVPPMPPTDNPRPYHLPGYEEPPGEWVSRNLDAVRWLIDNHAAIRAALTR